MQERLGRLSRKGEIWIKEEEEEEGAKSANWLNVPGKGLYLTRADSPQYYNTMVY